MPNAPTSKGKTSHTKSENTLQGGSQQGSFGINASVSFCVHTPFTSVKNVLFLQNNKKSVFSVLQSAVYSTVDKTNCGDAVNEDDKEHDYSSIAEIKGLVTASSSSDLYATVRDIYSQPDEPQVGEDPVLDSTDPGYETIRIPKTSSPDDEHRAEGSDAAKAEPDYESVGELGLSRETSRL